MYISITDEGVQERYENNNQDSTVANIQCPGGEWVTYIQTETF